MTGFLPQTKIHHVIWRHERVTRFLPRRHAKESRVRAVIGGRNLLEYVAITKLRMPDFIRG